MAFTFEIKTDRQGNSYAEITGAGVESQDLTVPENIDGIPVKSIASHAFAGAGFRQIALPKSIETIRSFAFYGCLQLEKLSLHNGAQDLYDGVIRNCPSLSLIEVVCDIPDNYVTVRELLRDEDRGLRFRLLFPDGRELFLTFPEYVREAMEDTMARAIHFSTEGAGVAYRECVGKYRIDYDGYDRLTGRLTDYDFAATVSITLDRLMYPEELRETAGARYEEFVSQNAAQLLELLIRQKDTDRIRFLTEKDPALLDRSALEKGAQCASALGQTQICALIMDALMRGSRGQDSDMLLMPEAW